MALFGKGVVVLHPPLPFIFLGAGGRLVGFGFGFVVLAWVFVGFVLLVPERSTYFSTADLSHIFLSCFR